MQMMEDSKYFDKVAQLQFVGNTKQPESLDIDMCEITVQYQFAKELRLRDYLQLFKHPKDENYIPSFWITDHKLGDQIPYNKFSGHAYQITGRSWNVGMGYQEGNNFLTIELTWRTGI
jgi:hypothetical protein